MLARATEPHPHSRMSQEPTDCSQPPYWSLTSVLFSTLSSPLSSLLKPRISFALIALFPCWLQGQVRAPNPGTPSSCLSGTFVAPASPEHFILNSKLLLKVFICLEWLFSSPPLHCTAPFQALHPSWGSPRASRFSLL